MKGPVPKQPPWQLTAEEIAGVVGGTLVSGEQDEQFGPVSIDTRTLAAGDLFFAIRGDRFDGHDFVSGALDCGARGVVVSDRRAVPTSATRCYPVTSAGPISLTQTAMASGIPTKQVFPTRK